VQGYHIGRPLPAAETLAFLRAGAVRRRLRVAAAG
jgi:hypothetical protein